MSPNPNPRRLRPFAPHPRLGSSNISPIIFPHSDTKLVLSVLYPRVLLTPATSSCRYWSVFAQIPNFVAPMSAKIKNRSRDRLRGFYFQGHRFMLVPLGKEKTSSILVEWSVLISQWVRFSVRVSPTSAQRCLLFHCRTLWRPFLHTWRSRQRFCQDFWSC